MKPQTTDQPGNKTDGHKADRSQAQILTDLGRDAELFHSPQDEAYAIIPVRSHHETWPIRHNKFRLWLVDRFYEAQDKPPSTQAIADALAMFEAKAQLRSPERPVFLRVGEAEGAIYLDLANDQWQVVEIKSSGWRVCDRSHVCFRRTNGMQALPCPVPGGSIEALRPFLNVGDDGSWYLVVGWLVGALRPRGPYPLLVLQGEQGSAKSTAARMLRRLIDPSVSPLRTVPPGERDLMISAVNAHVLSFDNLSGIAPWLSDAFCRLSTGGGFAIRELYTNTEETILDAQRPVILNGIDDLAIRQDLFDRAIVLNHPSIPEASRRPESDLWKAFEVVQPNILGALCTAVATALAHYAAIELPCTPRMADFAKWVVAATPALGWSEADFLNTYTRNRRDAVELGLEASLVAGLIRSLLDKHKEWHGTASELLNEFRHDASDTDQRSRAWPRSAHALTGQIRRLMPALRSIGIAIEFHRAPKTGNRLITLRNFSESSVTSVTPVTPSADQGDAGDGGDGDSELLSAREKETTACREDVHRRPSNNAVPKTPTGISNTMIEAIPEGCVRTAIESVQSEGAHGTSQERFNGVRKP
jgi:hypothetical protein